MVFFALLQGFVFPPEAGYALDLNQARFYLMETHYNNPKNADDFSSITMRQKADSSGLKFYYTDKLRKYDAGVLSIGKWLIENEIYELASGSAFCTLLRQQF